MDGALAINSSTDYCRAARRLRHSLADRPTELYQQLRKLSADHDRKRAVAKPAYRPDSKAGVFAAFVTGATAGSVLRYSKRQELLRVAAQFGIKRFEANLIIAAIEHGKHDVESLVRSRDREGAIFPISNTAPMRSWLGRHEKRGWHIPAFTIFITEFLIGLAVWLMIKS